MQTMMTTLRRGRNVYDPINMPVSEFKARIKDVQAEMKKKNLNLLLIFGIGPDEYGDACYLTNFVPMIGSNIAILTQDGKLTLIFSGSSRGIEYEQATTWVEDFRPSGGDIVTDCLTFLKDSQMLAASNNIGVVGFKEKMSSRQLKALYDGCSPSKIIEVDEIIRSFRVTKSTREQDQIKRSARTLNHIFSLVTGMTFSNLNERQIEAVMDKEARLEGSEDFRMLIGKPREDKWALRPTENKPVNAGETLIIYASVARERYWAESIRTFKVEGLRLVLVEQPAFSELYRHTLQELQPGKIISAFCKETQAELQKRKLTNISAYGWGEGIGLSAQERPVLSETENIPLKKGMCLAFRLGIENQPHGAIMLGDTICLDQ